MPAAPPSISSAASREREAEALLRLVLAGGRASPRRRLLDVHGSAVAALAAGPCGWQEAGLAEAQCARLRRHAADPPGLATGLQWLAQAGQRLVGWRDEAYPAALRDIASPPVALFVVGDADALALPAVAVVGTRQPTAGGLAHAARFAGAIAEAGLVVVSGLAAGIDAAAHAATLDRPDGRTVAVLGTGPERRYPQANAALYDAIPARGALASEHPPGTPVRREHFPSRNRILSGLAAGVLVVEAASRSGALITARMAAEAGREAMALPGSIDNPMARGCHRLLREGATLVERPEELLELLAPRIAAQVQGLRRRLDAAATAPADPVDGASCGPVPLDPDHDRLWQALGHDPTPMEELVERTALTAAELSSMLLLMELQGRVVVEHGRYTRKR